MTVDDIVSSSIEDLSRAIVACALSPTEILDAFLGRIEEYDSIVGSFAHLDVEGARKAALRAQRESRRPWSQLHGIPFACKDNIAVRGLPRTAGSRVLAPDPVLADAECVRRLRQAGAVCLGTLKMSEFGAGGMDAYGLVRNPWHLDYRPGGSSSGPAAAVAAGFVTFALGTDTSGSVRTPAAWCGLVAVRPTAGAIPVDGAVPLSPTLDEVGVLTRSVADLSGVLRHLAPHHMVQRPAAEGLRIGVAYEPHLNGAAPDVIKAALDASSVLTESSASATPCDLPDTDLLGASAWAIAYSEAFALHEQRLAGSARRYTTRFLRRLAGAQQLRRDEIDSARRLAKDVTRALSALFNDIDVLLLPAAPSAAVPLGMDADPFDPGRFSRLASLSGFPAIVVPVALTSSGLPLSVQLVGRPSHESQLLVAGARLESAFGQLRLDAPRTLSAGHPAPRPLPSLVSPTVEAIAETIAIDFGRTTGMEIGEEFAFAAARELDTARTVLSTREPSHE